MLTETRVRIKLIEPMVIIMNRHATASRMVRALRCSVGDVYAYCGPDDATPLAGVGQSANGYDKFCNLETVRIQL